MHCDLWLDHPIACSRRGGEKNRTSWCVGETYRGDIVAPQTSNRVALGLRALGQPPRRQAVAYEQPGVKDVRARVEQRAIEDGPIPQVPGTGPRSSGEVGFRALENRADGDAMDRSDIVAVEARFQGGDVHPSLLEPHLGPSRAGKLGQLVELS